MAPATVVLTMLLLVALVFAGHVKSEHLGLGGSEEQELPPPPVAGGAFPNSQCAETRLYRGPCVEMLCAAACLVQMRHGGHCSGNLIKGHCYCFSCS
ncbi:hypothetical protein BDA96_02G369900 [Sorghum bicolor]|uniref:Knottin scorpion toxin-like domain-containing protein n=2 Tax=Sorghum bicolor TaxID=4558 RepID=A0A921RTD2_SORBI|nr:uncharacterized protein LOC110433123 [Sorghum bicolor]KAG0545540.1 hypothetical protein BDA96_02G369900 [Sorghum bicolor]KXG36558.1 hypothetical protein SORBI_3002G352900 [Sorghum bicolor]|eukprot:XP_021310471.1 uncharacterized protein LOC110433123 [Sorghum bicolor]